MSATNTKASFVEEKVEYMNTLRICVNKLVCVLLLWHSIHAWVPSRNSYEKDDWDRMEFPVLSPGISSLGDK